MDFELSDEQTMLRDTARDLLSKKYDIETLRAVTDTPLGWDRDVWKSLADIGILGLTVPEDDGGAGAGPIEASAVLIEMGRTLAPEPYIDAVLVPTSLLTAAAEGDARAELLGGIASGELLVAFAHHEAGSRWPLSPVDTTVTGGTISGTKTLVGHGDCADKLIVSARDGDDIGLFLVDADADGVTRTPYRTQDRRRGAQIVFDGAAATRIGSGDASAAIAEAEIVAQIAQCNEAVGLMERSLELTVEYLKARKQFGVTLAHFQTLTQRAADLYVLLELARSMAQYATMRLADGTADTTVASRAKLQIARSGRKIGQESIQMHGGIGMTNEYPIAHYMSRLTAISHTLGDAESHVAGLAAQVGDYDMITVG